MKFHYIGTTITLMKPLPQKQDFDIKLAEGCTILLPRCPSRIIFNETMHNFLCY